MKITIHINHYTEDYAIYNPILEKLLSENWNISKDFIEFIGTHQFRNLYLTRDF